MGIWVLRFMINASGVAKENRRITVDFGASRILTANTPGLKADCASLRSITETTEPAPCLLFFVSCVFFRVTYRCCYLPAAYRAESSMHLKTAAPTSEPELWIRAPVSSAATA